MSELPELTYFFSNLAYTAVITRQSDGLLSEEEAKEAIRRCDCHDELVDACERMYEFFADEIISDADCKEFVKAVLDKAKKSNP